MKMNSRMIAGIVLVMFLAVAYALFYPLQNSSEINPATSGEASVWEPVEAYIVADKQWHESLQEAGKTDLPELEKEQLFEKLRQARPDAEAAVTSALSIVQDNPPSSKLMDAARFLIETSSGSARRSEAMLAGMNAIATHQPGYDEWAKTMLLADVYTPPGVYPNLDRFFEQFSTHTGTPPEAVAAARYYAATRRMSLANQVMDTADVGIEDRAGHRDAAIGFATGLSRGVEKETFMKRQPMGENGERLPYPTFVEVEKDLLFQLEFLTVGGTVPDARATTVDGVDDALSEYKNQVVLLDFWATWCAPCIEALPKLDALMLELPTEQFEVISINTDQSVDTLTAFLDERPMAWTHWYIGENAELLRAWSIRGFPTYMLIDREGVLVARQFGLNDTFLDLVRRTVCDRDDASSC